ncbi:MAG: hypothetical protein KKA90_01925 [Nanoarchaeota archaeon]|nr:hypothetical protein [Nanoarchaeota archaeon]
MKKLSSFDVLGLRVRNMLPMTKRRRERFLFYMRIYNHTVRASANFLNENTKRGVYFLQIIKELTEHTTDYIEEDLRKQIHEIVNKVLKDKNNINQLIKKQDFQGRINTQLLIIENLCVLRLMKLLVE